jgi:hypothetical protein
MLTSDFFPKLQQLKKKNQKLKAFTRINIKLLKFKIYFKIYTESLISYLLMSFSNFKSLI